MKTYLLSVLLLLLSANLFAQKIWLGTSSGYFLNEIRPLFDNKISYKSASIPFNFRTGIGYKAMQAGIECLLNIYEPTYVFTDPLTDEERFEIKYQSYYFGGYFRYDIPNYTTKNGILFAKLNAGFAFDVQKKIENYETVSFKNTFAIGGGVGYSIKITPNILVSLEARANFSPRKTKDENQSEYENHNFISYGALLGMDFCF